MLTISEVVKRSHATAIDKGWWQGSPRTPLEIAALIHSEISEFVECMREPGADKEDGGWGSGYGLDSKGKPEGPLSELADAVIRIADYCGYKKWDLEEAIAAKMEYNRGRPHRHGGKVY